MDFIGILKAVLAVGGIGLIIGLFLGISNKVFAVAVDENEEKIREILPGNNCGGCGYAGCDALASAIAKGEADAGACPIGGVELANTIAKLMGTKNKAVKMVAFINCSGTCEKASDKYIYSGSNSCIEASKVTGEGAKSCTYGCLGLGSCIKACEYDAINIVDGIAVVDKEKCVGCGKCITECPKGIIEKIPYKSYYVVACNSNDEGIDVKKVCSVGCIGCDLCKKECPADAIEVKDFLAKIDQSKCVGCGLCDEKCPTKIIKEIEA